jgi:hypothetical protein
MLASLAAALLLGAPPSGSARSAGACGQGAGPGALPDTGRAIEALQARILERNAEGTLDNRRTRRALRDLDEVRRMDAAYREDAGPPGELQIRDILARLEALRSALGEPPSGAVAAYPPR